MVVLQTTTGSQLTQRKSMEVKQSDLWPVVVHCYCSAAACVSPSHRSK